MWYTIVDFGASPADTATQRPDLRAPRYIVRKNHIEAIAPGYWFVAHYPTLYDAPSTWRKEHVPYQTGLHIYDNNGVCLTIGSWIYACLIKRADSSRILSGVAPENTETPTHSPLGLLNKMANTSCHTSSARSRRTTLEKRSANKEA